MNGIESLIHTLVAGDVDTCFANPGTSEMLFVAAVDQVPELNCILCLTEGVVVGAADGYARMADKPAANLLHLGVGVANGLSSMHNARKAQVPMINVVGQNGTRHLRHESILDADIEGPLQGYSNWMRISRHPLDLANDTADAIHEANQEPGRVASMIVQADASWGDSNGVAKIKAAVHAPQAAPATIAEAATMLNTGNTVILVDGKCLRERGLMALSRLAVKTGAKVCSNFVWSRQQRGAGRPIIPAFPPSVVMAQEFLKGVDNLILVGAKYPVGTFSYPNMPASPVPDDMPVLTLTQPEEDCIAALEALVAAVGAENEQALVAEPKLPELPKGDEKLAPAAISAAVGHLLPDNAIITEESSTAVDMRDQTACSAPHDYLRITGGAIGSAIPLALGAAVACPDRPVLALQGDGGGMYNLQALWTIARQKANVTTVIYANRQYKILQNELTRMGVEAPKGNARELLEIGNPDLDWVALANGMGVSAIRATTNDEFVAALRKGFEEKGPLLIEAVL